MKSGWLMWIDKGGLVRQICWIFVSNLNLILVPQCWSFVWPWSDNGCLKAFFFPRDVNLCSAPDSFFLILISVQVTLPVLLDSPQFQVSHFTFGSKYSVYSIKNVFLLPLFPSPLLFCFYFWPPSSVAHVLDRHAPPALPTLTLAQPPPAPERPPAHLTLPGWPRP